jgi:hypothetical protein
MIISEKCCTTASVWALAGQPGLTHFSTFLIPLLKTIIYPKTELKPGAASPQTALPQEPYDPMLPVIIAFHDVSNDMCV